MRSILASKKRLSRAQGRSRRQEGGTIANIEVAQYRSLNHNRNANGLRVSDTPANGAVIEKADHKKTRSGNHLIPDVRAKLWA